MNPLDDNVNLLELVKKAQFGCQESMDSLAQQAQRGLFAYIYRLTLNYNVTEDLQQETLLEMVKSLKTLEHPERFWAWLYRTALGKVQHYFRDRQYEKVIQPMSTLDKEKLLQRVSGSYGDGLKNLINKELSQAIFDAMAKLKLRHRNILVLRCCEQLPYSEIAEVMDCSELAAQVLFFRAKHSLKRKLSKHGFGKGMLLGALGLFGQMTTPADAAPVTLSAASTKVGVAATVIGALTSRIAIVTAVVITTAALTVGTITAIRQGPSEQFGTVFSANSELVVKEDFKNSSASRSVEIISRLAAEQDTGGQAEPNIAEAEPEIETEAAVEVQRFFNLLVINEQTNEPIPNAALIITLDSDVHKDVTDEQGRCVIRLPEKEFDYFSIEVSEKCFVRVQFFYNRKEAPVSLPENYTLSLEPATPIGGFIQNTEGEPIEGARVFLGLPGRDRIEPTAGIGETKLLKMIEQATNSQGFWRCDHIPGEDEIVIVLRHPDYIDNLVVQGTEQEPSIEELHNLTSVLVMEKGFDVSGVVLDLDGQPIKRARVLKGPYRFLSTWYKNETYTDDQGKFRFINAKTGKMILTIKADGFAPALKEIIVHKETPPVEFRLELGCTICGRIVDSEDKPVENALVTANKWRGHRSIDWQSKTDSDGYFEWNNAPLDEVLFNVNKKGYMSICDLPMSCEGEYVIEIYQPLRMSGKVVCAESGEPIDNFKLIYMVDWGDTPPECPLCGSPGCLERVPFYPFTSGRYELSFDHPADEYRFRIEADGYIPAISPTFAGDEGDVVFDFELKKGTGPSGTIYLSDGRSAAEALVILCKPSQSASIHNGWITQGRHTQFVETGADGRFSFPPQAETYLLVVLADQGYAEVTDEKLQSSPDITIKPWGRVEGLLCVGDKPAADREVFLKFTKSDDPNDPQFEYEYSTETDTNGFFAFDSVPPGRVRIGRLLRLSSQVTSLSHVADVNVEPGQTVNVTIGGSGRPVIGKVIVPADYKAPVNFSCSYNSIRLRQPESQTAEDMEQRSYAFKMNSDGTFRIEDIPAGTYNLRISLHERLLETYGSRSDCIGQVNYDFVIPEMVDGLSDEPFDIGTLELEMN